MSSRAELNVDDMSWCPGANHIQDHFSTLKTTSELRPNESVSMETQSAHNSPVLELPLKLNRK